ncbi:MAG: kinase/pyrophosphorylase, partial [Bdellovibrionales bacterium]|nr:kinase/pyrophosphorylase [Bdellovibrionales bacterium]
MTTPHFVFILSDGTGETASTMVRAALVQYEGQDIQIVRSKNIRTEDQVRSLMEDVFQRKGMVVYTMVSPHMRKVVFESASEKGIPVVDLMGPLLNSMDQFFGVENSEHEA